MAGKVFLPPALPGAPQIRVPKPGHPYPSDTVFALAAPEPYVSRGAYKLLTIMEHFSLDVRDLVCLDAGASTGGFTDVLLRRGAASVVAVDVGYGQLAWSLQSDPRVRVLDRTNVRTLDPAAVAPAPGLIVGDMSFISLTLVLEPLLRAAADDADLLLMVKPQFEIGKERLGHGGVVRDPELRLETILTVAESAHGLGLGIDAITASPLPGPSGNVEYFLSMHAGGAGSGADLTGDALIAEARRAVAEGPDGKGARRGRTSSR